MSLGKRLQQAGLVPLGLWLLPLLGLLLLACQGLWPEEPAGGDAAAAQSCGRAAGLLQRADTLTLDGRRLKDLAETCVEAGNRPQLGFALIAIAEQYLGDLEASQKAASQALAGEPDRGTGVWLAPLLAFNARANLLAAEGEPLAAVREVDLAGGLLSRLAGARYPNLFSGLLSERAALLVLAGQDERARDSYRRALTFAGSPAQRFTVIRRTASAELSEGSFAAAYSHFQEAFSLAPAPPQALQMALHAYAAEAQGLGQEAARRGLQRRIEKAGLDLDLYPGLLLRYVLGEIDGDQLRDRADSESRLNPAATAAQVDYYIGLEALLAGDRPAAGTAFRRVVGSDVIALAEYGFALGALARL
ncbi:MAG: hypothetical protein Kilf2KO_02820 [Rhodospirillales bacterium]